MYNKLVIGLFFVLLIVGLSGCSDNSLSNEEERFIGNWLDDTIYEQIYKFKSGVTSNPLEIIVGTEAFSSGLIEK